MATPNPDPAIRHGSDHASLLYAVKRAEQVIRSHLDDLLKPAGITALQYTALTVLERHDGLPAAQLARSSFVTAQSMADMVRTLQERGFILREQNPRNRRELLIRLTSDGRQLLADYAGSVAAIEKRMVTGLSPRQVEQLRSALAAAYSALS
jgi:DNA-binding MarR family transcriptional regulator